MGIMYLANSPTARSYSADGTTWTNSTPIVYASAAFGHAGVIAVGGTILSSVYQVTLDGQVWTTGNFPSTQLQTSIAYGNGKYVSLSQTAGITYVSTDGLNWSTGTLPAITGATSILWDKITYGLGKFVAVGRKFSLPSTSCTVFAAYSSDGITWTLSTVPSWTFTSTNVYNLPLLLAYGAVALIDPQRFVAVNPEGVIYGSSIDGITWTTASIAASITMKWSSLAYGNNQFVLVGTTSAGAATSNYYYGQGASTFTLGTLPSVRQWTSVAYSGTLFTAVAGTAGIVAKSSTGTSWTESALPTTDNWNLMFAGRLPSYNNRQVVATSTASLGRVVNKVTSMVTTAIASIFNNHGPIWVLNLIARSTSSASYSATKGWVKVRSFVWAATKWIGVKHTSNQAVTSTDGATWTSHSLPATQMWSSVATLGTVHAAIASNSAVAASSADGITWTSRTLPNARVWTSLAASATTFVAVAMSSGFCVTSTDGITWTEHAMPFDSWVSVAYNGTTTFCAVSANGNSAVSTDNGATWTAHTMPDNINYTCVAWALNKFTAVASGPTNLAATSTDGVTWTRIIMPASLNWTSVGPGIGNPNV